MHSKLIKFFTLMTITSFSTIFSLNAQNNDFRVTNVTPQNELPASVKYPAIQIQFSQPVTELKALGTPQSTSPVVSIEPALKGVYRWYGTSILSFESEEEAIPQKIYTIKINPSLKSTQGLQIQGNLEYTFHTEDLKINSVHPGYEEEKKGNYIAKNNVPVQLAKDIAVYFNAPVNVSVVKDFISVKAGKDNTRSLNFSATQEDKNIIHLTVQDDIPEDTDIAVTLNKGAMADRDCWPSQKETGGNFHTLLKFKVTDTETQPSWYSENYHLPVIVYFSTLLKDGDEENLAKHIEANIDANTSVKITKENLKINGQSITIHSLPVTYEKTYSLTIKKDFTDIYGRKLGSDYTFKVTTPPAKSFARFNGSGLRTLESQLKPFISFSYQNIKAPAYYTIEPLTDATGKNSSEKAKTVTIDVDKTGPNKIVSEKIDLRPYLSLSNEEYRGAVRFKASIPYEYRYRDWKSKEYKTETATAKNEQIIQVTDLAVTARYGYNKAIVFVSSMKTGKPVANAKVNAMFIDKTLTYAECLTQNHSVIASASTDANGIAEIDFTEEQIKTLTSANSIFFEAKTDTDRILYAHDDWGRPAKYSYSNSSLPEFDSILKNQMVAFLFTDRKLYKPGETVSYIIIDRNLKKGVYCAVPANESDFTVELTGYSDGRQQTYGTNKGKLSKQGSNWGSFTLPEDLKPGDYNIIYSRICDGQKSSESIPINVQFFEKLRFEASSSIEDSTYIYGDSLSALISANYLGGGSLADSTYSTRWRYEGTSFIPQKKEYKSMRFGTITHPYTSGSLEKENGVLDSDGKASTEQATNAIENNGIPIRYTAETLVTDSGNQAISTSTSAIVHPAQFYIGIGREKNVKSFAKKGDNIKFDYVCITPEEEFPAKNMVSKSGEITAELIHEEWKRIQNLESTGYISNIYEKVLNVEETKNVKLPTSAKPSEITVKPKESGTYLLRMTCKDSKGNPVITERSFYVTGSGWNWNDGNNGQQIKLIPDKDEYNAGDTAHILTQTELPKGTYLITIEREGILSEKTVTVTEPTNVLDVKIEESYVPVIYVSVSTYSVRPDTELPKSYYGVTALNVNTTTKKIDIKIKTDKESYQPGDKAKVTLTATQNGKPVKNAAFSLMAVDRGVLDLIGYHVEDPLTYFYDRSRFWNRTKGGDSRSLLIVQDLLLEETRAVYEPMVYNDMAVESKRVFKMAAAPMMADGSAETDGSNMKIRSNFASTAAFEPCIVTDKSGTATYTFTLPDSLTSYRITAVAINETDAFGLAEEEVSVCEPISVRTALPRMLRLDDKGELGAVISNLTNKAQNVEVELNIYEGVNYTQNTNDIQKLPGLAVLAEKKNSKKIKIAANKTQPLMFQIKALKQGWITVEFTVTGNNINEKILLPLQIEKPYIFETVTTTGSTEDTTQETIIIPQDADDGHCSLYIQLDPTRLGVLREAVSYVFHYPYGCLEQRSAAVLPLVAFGDYIHIFGLNSEVMYPKGVAEQEIHSWASVQKADGGFPYWKDGKESNLYVSMRIAEIAALAKQNGIPTGNINLSKLASYLTNAVENELSTKEQHYAGALYNAAYASYTATLIGADVKDTILSTIAQNDNSDVETLELTALTYLAKGNVSQAQTIAQKILSYTRMTSRGIDISQKYKNHRWCFFNDDSERYALLLQLLTKLDKKDITNQHCVYELLKMQKAHNGRWQSTAVTSRVLIALNEYIKTNNLDQLDFTAEALLNGSKELSGTFKGVSAQPVETTITPKAKEVNLQFNKIGQGNLYYTASMKYALPAEKQTARDEGLCIYTEITDVKTGKPVKEKELIAGNVYRERVIVSSRIRAEYVAVRAPVPAGCEILNTAFVTTGTLEEVPDEQINGRKTFYTRGLSYKGIYDSEVQFFWDYFPAGMQQVEFQFRAVRNGEYHTPSTTAECMYEEEIFGRTDGKVWIIK